MGLPEGWVTDVITKRGPALRCLGNGVVPQQAALALGLLDPHASHGGGGVTFHDLRHGHVRQVSGLGDRTQRVAVVSCGDDGCVAVRARRGEPLSGPPEAGEVVDHDSECPQAGRRHLDHAVVSDDRGDAEQVAADPADDLAVTSGHDHVGADRRGDGAGVLRHAVNGKSLAAPCQHSYHSEVVTCER